MYKKYKVSYPVLVEKINNYEYSFKIEVLEDKIDPIYSDDIISGLNEITEKVKETLKFYILDNIDFPKFVYPNMLDINKNRFYNIISFEVEIDENEYENINIHIPKEVYKNIYPLISKGYSISKLLSDMIIDNY